MARAKLGLTLALLKPDLVLRQYAAKVNNERVFDPFSPMLYYVQEVKGLIEKKGFYIVHRDTFRLGITRATQLYQEHKCKYFITKYGST